MIFAVCSVYDSKALAFAPPFFMSHIDLAKRAFAHAAKDPQSQIGQNPEDFTLYYLGSFNDDNAKFEFLVEPKNLGLAIKYAPVQARANLGAID